MMYGMEDQISSFGSIVSAMNNFFVSRYPPEGPENQDSWYSDPTSEIEAARIIRRQERERPVGQPTDLSAGGSSGS